MSIKKYVAEFIGTAVLVLFGCGTAAFGGGLVATAIAFGLSVIVMAYTIGKISGCHINPAVSAAMFLDGKMSLTDFIGYIIAQFLGAIAGALTIVFIQITNEGFKWGETLVGANGITYNFMDKKVEMGPLNMLGMLIVEVILTFIFILVVLAVTENKKTAPHAGIFIGIALTFVHILGINLTGTSVNPARSFGPALFGGKDALVALWVFIVAPVIGTVIAVIVNKTLIRKDNTAE